MAGRLWPRRVRLSPPTGIEGCTKGSRQRCVLLRRFWRYVGEVAGQTAGHVVGQVRWWVRWWVRDGPSERATHYSQIQQSCYDTIKRFSLDAGMTPTVPLCECPPLPSFCLPLDFTTHRLQPSLTYTASPHPPVPYFHPAAFSCPSPPHRLLPSLAAPSSPSLPSPPSPQSPHARRPQSNRSLHARRPPSPRARRGSAGNRR